MKVVVDLGVGDGEIGGERKKWRWLVGG